MTVITIQDPSSAVPEYLLEQLLEGARSSTSGGAIFAFATRDGARLFIGDSDFRSLLDRGTFQLVVGIDAITNVPAVAQLRDYAAASPTLEVKVFIHDTDVLFHPKLAWFRSTDGGVAFVGSGNLTPGGLSTNWEAYVRVRLNEQEVLGIEQQWRDWLAAHDSELFDIEDPAVDARAVLNVHTRRRRPSAAPQAQVPQATGDTVLLAEIPKASDRWKQANFDLASFTGFFGADPVASHRIVLWRLDDAGAVVGIESRPTVSVRSHNYRVELDAATGLAYPGGDDRPIGAFLRIAPRRFRYVLLMPGNPGYAEAMGLLDAAVGLRRPNRMRRHEFPRADVEAQWPGSPLFVPAADAAEEEAAPSAS